MDIEAILDRYGLKAEYARQRALLVLAEEIPDRLRPFVQPLFLRDGVIGLGVASSSVAQELAFLESHLLKKVNTTLGRLVVQRLVYRTAVVSSPAESLASVQPTAAERRRAEGSLGNLPEGPLRQAFAALAATDRARQAALMQGGGKRCLRCGVVFRGSGRVCPGCRFDPVEATRDDR